MLGPPGRFTRTIASSMRTILRPRVLISLVVAALVVAACVISTTTSRVTIDRNGPAQTVITPLKVHLRDGGLIVYPGGASIGPATVDGTGQRFDVARDSGPAETPL